MSDQPPAGIHTDQPAQPQEWREGHVVQLQADRLPDNGDAAYPQRDKPPADDGRSIPSADYGDRDAAITAARAEVDAADPSSSSTADARVGVAAADPSSSSTAAEQFQTGTQNFANGLQDYSDCKQVEYTEPEPLKEVPFVDPRGSDSSAVDAANDQDLQPDPTDQSDSAAARFEERSQQEVIEEAKADLADRERRGEVLGGDPINRADQWHLQGDNDRGYQNDCALASTAAVLQDCGVDVAESDIVKQAASENLCETGLPDAKDNGGSDGPGISQLLSENGVDNQIENPQSAEELAAYVEAGRGVIAEVNGDELRGTPSSGAYYDEEGRVQVDHAVQVTGTVRDSERNLTGFVINDTGSEDGAGQVVPLDQWLDCWDSTTADHETIVTTRPTSVERANR